MARKLSWRFLALVTFLEKEAWLARRFAWGRRRQSLRPRSLLLKKNEMIRVLHAEHELSDRFIAHMLGRNIRVEEDLIDQLFNSTEKRLARTLLLLARYGKEGQPEPVLRKISQETLAEIVGTTRTRVNLFMNKFRKLGFIEYNGEITVKKSLLSVVLHD